MALSLNKNDQKRKRYNTELFEILHEGIVVSIVVNIIKTNSLRWAGHAMRMK